MRNSLSAPTLTLLVSALSFLALNYEAKAQAVTLTAAQTTNRQALFQILPLWMGGKDSAAESTAQANYLRQFGAKFAPNAVIGVIPQGSNIHIPFARQFYGRSGAQTFARYHWNTVSSEYNHLTPDEQAAHEAAPGDPRVRHPGGPLSFDFLGDNVIHVVNTADVTVRATGRSVHLVIDETWTFDSAHQVQSALFTYSTSELNAAFQPAQP